MFKISTFVELLVKKFHNRSKKSYNKKKPSFLRASFI